MIRFHIYFLTILGLIVVAVSGIYVDKDNPYNVGKLTTTFHFLSELFDKSPLHTAVAHPTSTNQYPVVFFVGGLNGYIWAEYYSNYMALVASHGFFVLGVDYKFPGVLSRNSEGIGQDLNVFFEQIEFTKSLVSSDPRFKGIQPDWSRLGLLCHSSGCDVTLRMIRMNYTMFAASVFLEPFSVNALEPINNTIPSLMYGTQYSEEGRFHCCIKGIDYNRFYEMWKRPRIVLEVADFGHCDILDLPFWEACHLSSACKTSNDTLLPQYRRFVQGVTASFLITELQGYPSAVSYVTDPTKSPFRLLEQKVDI